MGDGIGSEVFPEPPAGAGGGRKIRSEKQRNSNMYLTFPSQRTVHVHDDKTGRVITSNSLPEPIESGQVTGEDQFVIYTATRVFVFRKYRGSPNFGQVQVRAKNI